MENKCLIKKGNKIIGFVYKDNQGAFWYAFGKPSQSNFISFECTGFEHGIEKIKQFSCLEN